MKYIQSNEKLTHDKSVLTLNLITAIQQTRRFSKFGKFFKFKLDKEPKECSICGGRLDSDGDYYVDFKNQSNCSVVSHWGACRVIPADELDNLDKISDLYNPIEVDNVVDYVGTNIGGWKSHDENIIDRIINKKNNYINLK